MSWLALGVLFLMGTIFYIFWYVIIAIVNMLVSYLKISGIIGTTMDIILERLEAKIDRNKETLDRILSILDARENKKQKDRERIKLKREQEATKLARERGAIVVDKLAGTFERDSRLPYKKWAHIMLEFNSAQDFLRWLVNEYLGSYHCTQDARKRMIARNGNYWKVYKVCGSEMMITPADMFGGQNMKSETLLEVQMIKWCFKHVMPLLKIVCNADRLEHVHENHQAWDDEKVNELVGEPLPLESRWWQKGARFREFIHACVAPYGRGYVRTSKGSMIIDSRKAVLEREETKTLFKAIYSSLKDGVMNRNAHEAWMKQKKLHALVESGIKEFTKTQLIEGQNMFIHQLKKQNAIRIGMELAANVKEEQDLQQAIGNSIKDVCSPSLASLEPAGL
jgi:hypothetical protein